ncbi:MAG TPA: dienelactone hydrolase family protein [Mycobacteriales bacterium]|nr:dienelactone hydrolase family protein [Mycobacteriales bacterium]
MPDIDFPASDGVLRGYLATPAGAGPWPGVVVVHEAFGLTDDIRRQADRFADHGYLALAPDLYSWASTPRCLVATFKAMAAGRGRAIDDLQRARRFLADRGDCTGNVGVIGFCLGGGFALLVAAEGFAAAAPNYGQLPRQPERVLAGSCPIVASYGAKDWTLRGAAPKLERTLARLSVPHDVKEYADAGHGFLFEHHGKVKLMEPWMVRYDAAAADDAWRRIFDFFDEHLKVSGEDTGGAA